MSNYTPPLGDLRSAWHEWQKYDEYGSLTGYTREESDAEVDRVIQQAKAEGHREGYETARKDMVSGAFIGGPTYEALRKSFTGRRIASEALRESADQTPMDCYDPRHFADLLYTRADRIAAGNE